MILSNEIKEKVLQESNLEKALEILKPYKNEKWEGNITKHLQDITPKDEIPIEDFSYIKKR